MAKTFKERIASSARGHKKLVVAHGRQITNTAKANANEQAVLTTNSIRGQEATSAISNPAKNTREDAKAVGFQTREGIKQHLKAFGDHLKLDVLAQSVTQLAAHGLPLINTGTTVAAMARDGATLIAQVGMAKANGYKLIRQSDGYMVRAHFVDHVAATTSRTKAVAILQDGTFIHANSIKSLETTGIKAVIANESVTRVAEGHTTEATDIVHLAAKSIKYRANIEAELAATGKTTVSGGAKVEVLSGVAIDVSAPLLTFTDRAGGTIRMGLGVIDINPLVSSAPKIPVIIPSVIPHIPLTPIASIKTVPQYEGMNAQSTSFMS